VFSHFRNPYYTIFADAIEASKFTCVCHKFPVIQKSTLCKLLKTLLTHCDVMEKVKAMDQINSILSNTTWPMSPDDNLRLIRNSLCNLLSAPAPAVINKPILAQ